MVTTSVKFRRINNASNDVMPCWRKGFEFWGTIDPQTGNIQEEHFDRVHLAADVKQVG